MAAGINKHNAENLWAIKLSMPAIQTTLGQGYTFICMDKYSRIHNKVIHSYVWINIQEHITRRSIQLNE